jgi:hypothetical protein
MSAFIGDMKIICKGKRSSLAEYITAELKALSQNQCVRVLRALDSLKVRDLQKPASAFSPRALGDLGRRLIVPMRSGSPRNIRSGEAGAVARCFEYQPMPLRRMAGQER